MKQRITKRLGIMMALVLALSLCACAGGDSGADWSSAAPAQEHSDSGEIPEEAGEADWEGEAGSPDVEPDSEGSASASVAIKPSVSDEEADSDGSASASIAFDPDGDAGSAERYLAITENDLTLTAQADTLAFSLKVDTASYSNVARYLESGSLPPADAVKTEELVNYFRYETQLDFPDDAPFAVYTELGPSPFDPERVMAFVRVKTPELDRSELPSSNFTFLIDTSGSMNSHDKLPLLKESLALLVEELDGDDTVSIVTYAGSSEVLLDSVSGADKDRILAAIESLSAGGSTAGANGILTAYALAEKNFMGGGNNRVIIASDGDFNVGVSSLEGLTELIAEKRDSGVYLSVLGFGAGNLRDDIMETLAANGNGNYSYIDNLATARKVLVEEMAANLFTVADDVKAQIAFNPDTVRAYRLIGYENRRMTDEQFEDDATDAGEIGVGTDLVMLFELELHEDAESRGLRAILENVLSPDALFEVRIRYKDPGESESKQVTVPVNAARYTERNSTDFGFACSVAGFGHLLRGSEYTGSVTLEEVTRLARENLGGDAGGYRLDYLLLLRRYEGIVG